MRRARRHKINPNPWRISMKFAGWPLEHLSYICCKFSWDRLSNCWVTALQNQKSGARLFKQARLFGTIRYYDCRKPHAVASYLPCVDFSNYTCSNYCQMSSCDSRQLSRHQYWIYYHKPSTIVLNGCQTTRTPSQLVTASSQDNS